MSKFNREKLIKLLQKYSNVTIQFEKADGTIQTRHATRNQDIVYQLVGPKPSGQSRKEEIDAANGNITYFDLDKNDFRSFKVERLKSIKVK